MGEHLVPGRRGPSYRDDELARAVAAASSWRAVLRHLGLQRTSGIRSVRHHADRLGLDYSHFTGGRRWTDGQLAEAVADSNSWGEVGQRLGLLGGSSETALKGHARRLGLDTAHFWSDRRVPLRDKPWPPAEPIHLSRAGSMLAAAWFLLRGYDVAWPFESCRYDLLVKIDGTVERIQVKTTITRSGESWRVSLSRGGLPYDPDEIDYFFAIDGELHCYLIPVAAVAGMRMIHLAGYQQYQVADHPLFRPKERSSLKKE